MSECLFVVGNAKRLPLLDRSVDLVLTSPPYEACRTYGLGYKHRGQEWVDDMVPCVLEACRVSKGLVIFVMSAQVRDYKYSCAVEWLVADLTRIHGVVCGPAPYVFYSPSKTPGSGGDHFHRRDWEPCYAFCFPDRLPPIWSDNTATGHEPKWNPGGEMSNRGVDGTRANAKKRLQRDTSGISTKGSCVGRRVPAGHTVDGEVLTEDAYFPPRIANSGNVVQLTYLVAEDLADGLGDVVKCRVGGGHMGSDFASENEAPFPESLCEFFIKSYCPPGGWVLDPFSGSGTTVATSIRLGRNGIGLDIRPSQAKIGVARLSGLTVEEWKNGQNKLFA